MGCYEGWTDAHPNDFYPSGLAPDEVASVTRVLEPDRWSIAEERTAELIACIQPNQLSEERRSAVTSYVQRLITSCISCQVFKFGSVPLKTYLPDGDIDLTAFGNNESSKDTWANEVRDMLMSEEKNENAEFCVKEVQYIQAEVKIIKCLVDDIVVDISFNQLGGLCTLCFLEDVDRLVSQNHLFKRSIILIKAWCYYESRILGAHHGLISTYALETLVLYIFHVFNDSFAGPLEVLYRFLEFFNKFDWDNFCVGLWGPVSIRSLPDMTADPPRKDGGELLLSKPFLNACSSVYSACPIGQENHELPFMSKHFNVIDPLKANNNLGLSVSKGNFFRIRSAFVFGAQHLTRLLDCSKENIVAEVDQFFMNTLNRHGKQLRHDAPRLPPVNMGWTDAHPNAFYPSGLAPDEVASVTRVLEPDRSSIAEERTAELIACILPNQLSEERGSAVTSYVQRLNTNCFSCQVFSSSFGSVPLKTYLPDGDIDVTAFGNNESSKDTWANEVRDMLMSEEKNENAEFCVKEVQYIQAEVWLGKEFQINYPNLNCKIKNLLYGSTYEVQCWTTTPLDFKNKIVHMMKNQQEAIQLKNVLESIKHSSICDKYDVGTCQNASTVVSREEFVGDTLTAWIAKLKSAWEYNKSGRWSIGLGTDTKSVLRAILRGLQAIHNAGAYHGNIKEGVRISPQNEVMIATSTYVTTVGSVEDGIRKDIGDFQDIVKMVVRDHPITPPTPRPGDPPAAVPRVVEMFYALCALLPKNTTQDFCFFIYNTPLVWEGEERFLFKDIVWNIKNRNDSQFQTMLFDKNFTDMTNWQGRIPIDLKSTLYTILMYNQTGVVNHNLKYPNAMYNYNRGFVDFERNFLVHYQTHVTIELRKKSRLEIERQIYNILPESCSVVYYALVLRFQNSSTLFFRDNLEKMFKAKPSPCY